MTSNCQCLHCQIKREQGSKPLARKFSSSSGENLFDFMRRVMEENAALRAENAALRAQSAREAQTFADRRLTERVALIKKQAGF